MNIIRSIWDWLDDPFYLWNYVLWDIILLFFTFEPSPGVNLSSHLFIKLIVVALTFIICCKITHNYLKLFQIWSSLRIRATWNRRYSLRR